MPFMWYCDTLQNVVTLHSETFKHRKIMTTIAKNVTELIGHTPLLAYSLPPTREWVELLPRQRSWLRK